MPKISIKSIVYGSVGILILFILASTIMLPQFSRSYRYCQARKWYPDADESYTNCSARYDDDWNTSQVSSATYTQDGETSPTDWPKVASSWCINCDTAGGYRVTNQGLVLLVLVIALIGFAVYFIPKFR